MIVDALDLEEYNGEDSRINGLVDDVRILKTPDRMMEAILTLLTDTVMPIPQVGCYYTFSYKAKTPRVRYDSNPLIACTGIYQWGFTGINYHWGDFRNYAWEELVTNPFLVYPSELEDLRSIPYQNYKINNS
jgi:hypothetical protein